MTVRHLESGCACRSAALTCVASSIGSIRMLHLLLRPVWTRIFSGVDIREEDLERLRDRVEQLTAMGFELTLCQKAVPRL